MPTGMRRKITIGLSAAAVGSMTFLAVAQDETQRVTKNATQDAQPEQSIVRESPMVFRAAPRARFVELLRPQFRRSDLPLFTSALELDQSQRLVLEMLIEDYQGQLELAAAELNDAKDRIRVPANANHSFAMGQINATPMQFSRGDADVIQFPPGTSVTITMDGMDGTDFGREGGTVSMVMIRADVQASESSDDENDGDEADDKQDARKPNIDPETLKQMENEIKERARQRAEELAQRLNEILRQRTIADEDKLDPEEVLAIAKRFCQAKQDLAGRFVADLQAILTPAQMPKLDNALNFVLVTNDLQHGRISGESLNVSHTLRTADLQSIDRDSLETITEQWIDTTALQLTARSNTLIEQELAELELMIEDDFDRRVALAEKEAERRATLRDTNLAIANEVAALLEESEQAQFSAYVDQTAFPRIFAPTPTWRALEAALNLEDIQPETREAIAALLDEYKFAVGELNDQILRATLEEEPRRRVDQLAFVAEMRSIDFASQMTNPEQGQELHFPRPTMMRQTNELYSKRNQLGRRMLRMLNDMLTVEQFETLPLTAAQRRTARGETAPTIRTFTTGDGATSTIRIRSGDSE